MCFCSAQVIISMTNLNLQARAPRSPFNHAGSHQAATVSTQNLRQDVKKRHLACLHPFALPSHHQRGASVKRGRSKQCRTNKCSSNGNNSRLSFWLIADPTCLGALVFFTLTNSFLKSSHIRGGLQSSNKLPRQGEFCR